MLITWSEYKVIRKKYDNLLDDYDDVTIILKSPPKRVTTYLCALFHRAFTAE